MHKTRINPSEWNAKNYLEFFNTNDQPNPDQKTRPRDNFKKRELDALWILPFL